MFTGIGNPLYLSLKFAASWCLQPIFLTLVFALLGLRLKRGSSTKRVFIALAVIFPCLTILSPFPRIAIRKLLEDRYSLPGAQAHADAAVVLGGTGIRFDSEIGQYLWAPAAGRFIEAVRLVRSGRASKLVITSYNQPGVLNVLSETEVLKRLAIELGIGPEQIFLDGSSRNTCDHAAGIDEIFRRERIRNVFLVTSAFHMPRAMAVMKKHGFLSVIPYPVYDLRRELGGLAAFFELENSQIWTLLVHELLGFAEYRLKCCL